MTFPYDFGFLPQTLAADGDAIDVLLLMDEPAFPGIAVRARLIGVIEGEQIDGKKKIRNDRLVAVADANHMYANIRRLKDLPSKWIKELENFFVNYHALEGKEYRLLGCKGVDAAMRLVKKAHKKSLLLVPYCLLAAFSRSTTTGASCETLPAEPARWPGR
jgi:inorganic pyrophosphatase